MRVPSSKSGIWVLACETETGKATLMRLEIWEHGAVVSLRKNWSELKRGSFEELMPLRQLMDPPYKQS